MNGIDLFSGAGGMSLGASMAGITVQLAVEADPHAARTYAMNHRSTQMIQMDIAKLSQTHLKMWLKRSEPLVLFGGPPCQGFSWSNGRTRNNSNASNWLFMEFLRVAGYLEPEWIVFENVRGLVDTGKGQFLRRVCGGFERLGYDYDTAILNAQDFGVPQDRSRFFLVAWKKSSHFSFPVGRVARPLTVRDALRDLPRLNNGDSTCWSEYSNTLPSDYGQRMRGKSRGCCNHLVSHNAEFVVKRYAYVPQGGNWEDIPSHLMKNYSDRFQCHTGIYYRLKWNSPSIVIGNYRKNMLIHPGQNRGLSVREAARIQSFPDKYTFFGSIGFQQQQVGNAVPPLLAKAVFKRVLEEVDAK